MYHYMDNKKLLGKYNDFIKSVITLECGVLYQSNCSRASENSTICEITFVVFGDAKLEPACS
jgi:hypothetical protein